VLTIPTIGVFVLVLALGGMAALLARPGGRTSAGVGAISGAGLAPLYVAYLNRGGPGVVCRAIQDGQECTDAWSPWPWLGAGAFLVLTGVVAFAVLRAWSTGR
jgi:hypothetical protein